MEKCLYGRTAAIGWLECDRYVTKLGGERTAVCRIRFRTYGGVRGRELKGSLLLDLAYAWAAATPIATSLSRALCIRRTHGIHKRIIARVATMLIQTICPITFNAST